MTALFGNLKFVPTHFPFDAHQKIEVHAFGFKPGFQIFTGIGAKLDEHFSLEHVDEDMLGAREPAGLHALRERFGSLASEAGEGVLGEVAWHRNSWKRFALQVFHSSGIARWELRQGAPVRSGRLMVGHIPRLPQNFRANTFYTQGRSEDERGVHWCGRLPCGVPGKKLQRG